MKDCVHDCGHFPDTDLSMHWLPMNKNWASRANISFNEPQHHLRMKRPSNIFAFFLVDSVKLGC